MGVVMHFVTARYPYAWAAKKAVYSSGGAEGRIRWRSPMMDLWPGDMSKGLDLSLSLEQSS